ncbi:gliding motility-associated peptidyl-prolyl isomerase GldI [Aureibaculum sp. 2210JD6-5]|uniref:gliding motility-associated peptidyl-prolyl isomerase GldI n=1 Tax=Aureibaculum sp. 2210JD6-5 TaxID=3103957 RepID=UPI002AAEDAA5|nr:gliding motility-associated peptidyl-prolyl isomerase GldI [Aureibaculum sp. 2210JD6-5]MDY7395178.1 gliding motility-associated peptidyl-prolyl isomerase GldI [Aureibaculum sp. 2210JD6-5]
MNIKINNITNLVVVICFLCFFLACTTPQPRKPVVQKTYSFLQESIERNKIINKVEEDAFMELMKSDTTNNYIASESGFWYYYNIKNDEGSQLPKTGDEVTFTYQIKDINNEIIYTKEELGEKNYLVDKQELITGLQDGLKLMREGETVTFLFPSHKAYGYSGYQKIKSNEPLIYTVTLHKVLKNNP